MDDWESKLAGMRVTAFPRPVFVVWTGEQGFLSMRHLHSHSDRTFLNQVIILLLFMFTVTCCCSPMLACIVRTCGTGQKLQLIANHLSPAVAPQSFVLAMITSK